MSYIEVQTEESASGELARVYADLRKSRGGIANILKIHSLDPAALERHVALYLHLMFSNGPLTRLEREAVAVAVSAANGCEYCVGHHVAALKRFERDPARIAAIVSGDHEPLGPRLKALLDHARRLTLKPASCDEAALLPLRAAGFDDPAILRLTLVISYFNFVNRIAVGLGVEDDSATAAGDEAAG